MRLAGPPEKAQAARMDAPDLDLDEVFLDALEAVVRAALERMGDDPGARYRLFRRLLAAAEGAVRKHRCWLVQSRRYRSEPANKCLS